VRLIITKTLDNRDSLALASIVRPCIHIDCGWSGIRPNMGTKFLFENLNNFDRGIVLWLSFALDDDDSQERVVQRAVVLFTRNDSQGSTA
jgi:hypothetical protein